MARKTGEESRRAKILPPNSTVTTSTAGAIYTFFEFDYIMLENIFYEISDIVDNFSTAERNIAFLTYSIIP